MVGSQNFGPLPDVLDYATQIASGMQAAHEKGVTHRDIKFPDIKCDEYIVMPNHCHAVIMNVGADLRVCPEPDTHQDAHEGEHIGSPLPTIVQWFNTMTTNEYIRGVKQQAGHTFRANCGREIIMIA